MTKAFKDLANTVTFGKYQGKTWEELLDLDTAYFEWIVLNTKYRPPSDAMYKYIVGIATANLLKQEARKSTRQLNKDVFGAGFEDIPF